MPTKKTPQKKASPKIPSNLVYVFLESSGNEVEIHTFIPRSDPAFKTLKKDFKYCENAETVPAVFFPNVHVKSRCDEYWEEKNFSEILTDPDLVLPPLPKGYKTKPNNDLVHLLFMLDGFDEFFSTLISKSDPYFSKLKKSNPVIFESQEIPIFPKVLLCAMAQQEKKKRIIDYQKFHANYIGDITKLEEEEKRIKDEEKEFRREKKFDYELLSNHFRVNGIDRKLKEWLMVLENKAYKKGVDPKKMLKDLQSRKSFWEKK